MNYAKQSTLNTLFANLDRWRHFAGYPLEARVDAVMGLFLPKVIEACCGVEEMNVQIIPQFPLKKRDTNHSYKVDFLAVSRNARKGFLVEIKTDMGSRSNLQLEYLDKARQRGLACILSELKEVAKANKNNRRKYVHLLGALSEMNLIGLPNELEEMHHSGKIKDWSRLMDEIHIIVPAHSTLEVGFVQPCECTSDQEDYFRYIYFEEFADVIDRSGELGSLLACYLRKWRNGPGTTPSGEE